MNKPTEAIRLKADIIATDGKAGEVSRFFIDPESQRVEQLGVGSIGGERVLPLLNVQRVENDKVYVDLDKERIKGLALFNASAYRDPGLSQGRLPNWADEGNTRTDFQVRGDVGEVPIDVEGDRAGSTAVNAEYTPLSEREPLVSTDTDVLDADGKKVGKVAEFAVEQVTGIPASLRLHHGLLPGKPLDIPVDQIERFAPEGIVLKVNEEEIKRQGSA